MSSLQNAKPSTTGKLTRLTQQLRRRKTHLPPSTKLDNAAALSQSTLADDSTVQPVEGSLANKVVDEYEFDSSDEEVGAHSIL